jgi:hypothetical protein
LLSRVFKIFDVFEERFESLNTNTTEGTYPETTPLADPDTKYVLDGVAIVVVTVLVGAKLPTAA